MRIRTLENGSPIPITAIGSVNCFWLCANFWRRSRISRRAFLTGDSEAFKFSLVVIVVQS